MQRYRLKCASSVNYRKSIEYGGYMTEEQKKAVEALLLKTLPEDKVRWHAIVAVNLSHSLALRLESHGRANGRHCQCVQARKRWRIAEIKGTEPRLVLFLYWFSTYGFGEVEQLVANATMTYLWRGRDIKKVLQAQWRVVACSTSTTTSKS